MAAPSSCLEIGHIRKEGVVPDIVNSGADADQPTLYQIRLKGQLDHQWTDWFGGLAITLQPNGDTLLSGPIVDQAALHGVLRKSAMQECRCCLFHPAIINQAGTTTGEKLHDNDY